MIPIRDTIPCYCRPYVTWALMAISIALFLLTRFMPQDIGQLFLYHYGMVAARYTHPGWAFQIGLLPDGYFSFLSSMFLHGGWWHIIMNMWFMWIFADNIEDRMGHGRFLVFYLLCGLIGSFLQFYFNPDSTAPVVGASGAIAGIMGAYFFLYPFARVVIWVPLFFLPLFFEIPAIAFLGFWVIIQLHQATMSVVDAQAVADVAWWGHLGGFICGMLIHPFFITASSEAD